MICKISISLTPRSERSLPLYDHTNALGRVWLDEYISRHDPVEKAKRNSAKVRQTPVLAMKHGIRKAIPAPLIHQVNQRDQRKCTALKPSGQACNESRWTEIHHKTPISEGGKHELSNLITLCSSHHRMQHLPYGRIGGNFGRSGRDRIHR